MYGTSRKFLDYFGLKSLEEMPTLMELKELGPLNEEFKLGNEEPALEEEEEAHRVDLELAVNDQIEVDSNEPKISETNEPQDV